MKQIKKILVAGTFMLCIVQALKAQVKTKHQPRPAANSPAISQQLKNFKQLAADANVVFAFPKGFKELRAPNNEDLSFDYAIGIPDNEFEIWFQVRSQKANWTSYLSTLNSARQTANPDSLYLGMGSAQAAAFTGETDNPARIIPPNVTARYGANKGKSYLLNLQDMAITKHYKYALLITLQKNHTGTIMAVCLSNEKGPEFFNNIDKASHCIRFKP